MDLRADSTALVQTHHARLTISTHTHHLSTNYTSFISCILHTHRTNTTHSSYLLHHTTHEQTHAHTYTHTPTHKTKHTSHSTHAHTKQHTRFASLSHSPNNTRYNSNNVLIVFTITIIHGFQTMIKLSKLSSIKQHYSRNCKISQPIIIQGLRKKNRLIKIVVRTSFFFREIPTIVDNQSQVIGIDCIGVPFHCKRVSRLRLNLSNFATFRHKIEILN